MLKTLFIVAMLGFSQAQATQSQPIEVMMAEYVSFDRSIQARVVYQGCGNETVAPAVEDCVRNSDYSKVYTCYVKLNIQGNASCARAITKDPIFFADSLKYKNESLSSSTFRNSFIVIEGTNTSARVQMRQY